MSAQHTPGPWVIENNWLQHEDGPIVGDRYLSVCMSATRLADGQLIAAAPDLLDAAERAKVLIGARNDNLSEVARQCNINEAWHILNAAIAKARGETP